MILAQGGCCRYDNRNIIAMVPQLSAVTTEGELRTLTASNVGGNILSVIRERDEIPSCFTNAATASDCNEFRRLECVPHQDAHALEFQLNPLSIALRMRMGSEEWSREEGYQLTKASRRRSNNESHLTWVGTACIPSC